MTVRYLVQLGTDLDNRTETLARSLLAASQAGLMSEAGIAACSSQHPTPPAQGQASTQAPKRLCGRKDGSDQSQSNS